MRATSSRISSPRRSVRRLIRISVCASSTWIVARVLGFAGHASSVESRCAVVGVHGDDGQPRPLPEVLVLDLRDRDVEAVADLRLQAAQGLPLVLQGPRAGKCRSSVSSPMTMRLVRPGRISESCASKRSRPTLERRTPPRRGIRVAQPPGTPGAVVEAPRRRFTSRRPPLHVGGVVRTGYWRTGAAATAGDRASERRDRSRSNRREGPVRATYSSSVSLTFSVVKNSMTSPGLMSL